MLALGLSLQFPPAGAVAGDGLSHASRGPAWVEPAAPGTARAAFPFASLARGRAGLRSMTTTGWSVINLGTPAALQDGLPFAINQRGDVAIQFCPRGGCTANATSAAWYPYLFDARALREISLARFGTFRAQHYFPEGLNDVGTVVGYADLYDGTQWLRRAVAWSRVGATGSTIAFLDTRAGDSSLAYAVNDRNVIVGRAASVASAGVPLPVRFMRAVRFCSRRRAMRSTAGRRWRSTRVGLRPATISASRSSSTVRRAP